jgi:hypothetical protein
MKVERLKGAAGLMRQPVVSKRGQRILSGSSINEIDTDAG